MRFQLRFFLLLAALFSIIAGAAAWADCANPVGKTGRSSTTRITACRSSATAITWQALGQINPGAGGPGCSSPSAPEGTIIYNFDHHVPQYCDGDNWILMAGGGGAVRADRRTDRLPERGRRVRRRHRLCRADRRGGHLHHPLRCGDELERVELYGQPDHDDLEQWQREWLC